MSQLIFEGNIDELIDHFSQSNGTYSGLRFHVFAEPKAQAENSELRFDPPLTEQTEEQLKALYKAEPNTPQGIERQEAIAKEMRRRLLAVPEYYPDLPTPPTTVRDRAHLLELLDAGLNSPQEPATEEDWKYIRAEVRRRIAERKSK